jgi:hypothetical protein
MEFDSSKHYLGKLCPNGHEHEDTGLTLRNKTQRQCLMCLKKSISDWDKSHRCYETKKLGLVKSRAKKIGVLFSLPSDWLVHNNPKVCPVLGIPLISRSEDRGNAHSIDRLIPELGYTPENCRVISNRANMIKSNASVEELRLVADWLEKELSDPLFTNYYNQTRMVETDTTESNQ